MKLPSDFVPNLIPTKLILLFEDNKVFIKPRKVIGEETQKEKFVRDLLYYETIHEAISPINTIIKWQTTFLSDLKSEIENPSLGIAKNISFLEKVMFLHSIREQSIIDYLSDITTNKNSVSEFHKINSVDLAKIFNEEVLNISNDRALLDNVTKESKSRYFDFIEVDFRVFEYFLNKKIESNYYSKSLSDISLIEKLEDYLDPSGSTYAFFGMVNKEDLQKEIDDKFITNNNSLLSKIATDPRYKVPNAKEDGYYVSKDNWYFLARNIIKSINTLVVGDTGSGKTTLVELLAKRLGRPLFYIDMNSMDDPISAMVGTHRLKNGESYFDLAPFARHIQVPNAIILLDEINRSRPAATNLLFSCADDRRYLPIDLSDSGESKINVAEGVVFIGTANVGHDYSGTSNIDKALEDRFQTMELPYMSLEAMIDVSSYHFGESFPEHLSLENIIQVLYDIREHMEKNVLSVRLSNRGILELLELVVDGFSFKDSFERLVGHKIKNESDVAYVEIQDIVAQKEDTIFKEAHKETALIKNLLDKLQPTD